MCGLFNNDTFGEICIYNQVNIGGRWGFAPKRPPPLPNQPPLIPYFLPTTLQNF